MLKAPKSAGPMASPHGAFSVPREATRRISVEGSWVHMSHAQLFGRQNPGMDNIGVRLNLKL